VIHVALIELHNISKTYRVTKKQRGLSGAFKGLFRPERENIEAVVDLNLEIERGEVVGFIGPNGAGKSTTIKMLSGILHPTSGRITINGISPQEDRKAVVANIGVVFGQRTQLFWDLRLGESFELIKRIYRVTNEIYNENLEVLTDVLSLDDLIDIPVRQLSLGQRMRGELVAAMLHSPDILFLDEPTIGMDVEVKAAIRKFILEINRLRKTTILLTTHDLGDVEELCKRVVVINKGRVVADSDLKDLVESVAPHRYLIVEAASGELVGYNHPSAEVMQTSDGHLQIRFDRREVSASKLIADLSNRYEIRDITVKDPEIEDVIRKLYRDGK
jgi:ABC-2 type transport system ATP-binding protein